MSRLHNGLDVRPAHDRLNDEELVELTRQLTAIGVRAKLPAGDEGDVEEVFADVNEGALDEFIERLDSVGVRADLYLPVSFERTFSLSGLTCGSAHALIRALTKMRSELQLDFDPSERDRRLARQRNLWKRFRAGAKLAVRKGLVLEVVRF